MVENWIEEITRKLVTGHKTIRKAVTTRADDWEAQYKSIARRFNEIYAIEVIAKNKALRDAAERIEFLEAENLRLKMELSKGKVVLMPKKQ